MNFWKKANVDLISKSLAELIYEEVLSADIVNDHYIVQLLSEVRYKFKGKNSIWGFFQIEVESLERIPALDSLSAAQFFLDSQEDLGMSNITLAHFMEEMNNTLYSEMKILEKKSEKKTPELAELSGNEIQAYLSGHPKILLNKGRLGFSSSDLKKYAPENQNEFQVIWLAVKKDILMESDSDFSFDTLVEFEINQDQFKLIPVHPWQLDRFIRIQYQQEFAAGNIIELGKAGPLYSPQISIRTLADKTSAQFDLKLSLTILNTSAYRGISTETLKCGPALSRYLERICQNDQLLQSTRVLKEVYAASIQHPYFSKVQDAPYRYNELLGCVVRESAESSLLKNEKAVMAGSLFYVGSDDLSLLGEYISRSQLSAEEWMKRYFQHVIIPLYHLQLNYGIGIVSHGQNITLLLKDFAPSGMFVKDFQGDLRISEKFADQLPEELRILKTLPPEYLIHDLITGHFITVLRFISPILEKENLLSESRFYEILGDEIKHYLQTYHSDLPENHALNLLRPEFEKVILNKVRFKIGYEDSASRPLPILGKNLQNPLVNRIQK